MALALHASCSSDDGSGSGGGGFGPDAVCGDEKVEGREECDPPNVDNGCDTSCRFILTMNTTLNVQVVVNGGLEESQREVLRLRYVEDLSRLEIAEVLDIPESVVKSRIFEGLKKLREHASRLEER